MLYNALEQMYRVMEVLQLAIVDRPLRFVAFAIVLVMRCCERFHAIPLLHESFP